MLKQILLIWLYFSALPLFGQSLIDIKYYSVQDGLSQKNIQNFIQDDNGYIWMATWNGLERFDGYSFTNYKTYPESDVRITNHRFTNIEKSSLNNIWCQTYDKHCYLFNTRTCQYEDPFLFNKGVINSVEKLYVLRKGITWAVGVQNELFRLDENRFPATESVQLYTGKIENNIGDSIYIVMQDKDGDEWILTNKGATIVGKKSMANLMPFKFMVENADDIYLATSKGFFARYDYQSQNVVPCVPNEPMSEIIGLKSLSDHKIAILQRKEIRFYNPKTGKFTLYKMPVEISPDIYQDRKGIFWLLGVTGGVIRLDCTTEDIILLSYPKLKEVPFTKPCTFIHEDEYGCIWVNPVEGELYFYDPMTRSLEQAYVYEKGVRVPISFQAFSYFIDHHKNLWYTTPGSELGYLSFHQSGLDYIINRHKESARSLMEDHRKRVWIGWKRNHKTQPGNICLYDSLGQWIGNISQKGKIVADQSVSFNADVYCIYEDKDHNIWMGTREDGLFLFRFQGEDNYQVTCYLPDKDNPYSISSKSIFSILQDSSGRIWIGTFGGGINLVESASAGGDLKFVHYGNILNNYPIHVCEKVRCLYEVADGVILIGTTGGLLSCSTDFSRPEEIRFFHNVCDERYSSLSNNDILDITQTKGGKLLVTTLSGGINILDDGSSLSERLNFKHYNATNDRLPDLSLSSIEDQEGNIWIVSENKISKFDAGLNLLEEYKDQIQMAETRPVLLSSGKLLLGSLYGALCIIPDELHKSDFVPPIVFSHLDIYQNNTSRRQDIYSNDEAQYLQPDERNFTITFAALDYVNSPAIKYVYRIKGLNDQWIELGNNRSASLVNVPAGDYLFQVKSTNADGVWVDNVASLSIHIDPVFGETVWAVLLYITMAVVIMLVVICIVLRITNLQRRIDFEQQISNLKLRFFTDISHELRTPLTLIASPIDEVISNEKLSDAGMENMQVAKRNTDRMLRLINQILDFRKIQNDKMKVLVEQVDIIPLILKIYGNFVPMAHTHRIDFRLFCPLDSFVMYTDVDKLEKILFNLLSNAFKYTPDEKSISLYVTCEKQILCLQVKDEGRGINAQKLNRLFTRFDTLDEIDPNMSTGIGLSLVKELLNLLHGTVRVDSKLGEGSSFFIRLPGNRDVFDADANIEFILADSKNSGQEVAIPDKLTEEEEDKETRILIIEDNEELRHFICGVLAREYVVLEAGNGCQGLEMTLRELPDIVISDIMMPEMDGIEYLKRVKGNNDICHIPIILLSAKSSLNDQIQGLEYGADEYITKPFSSAYLKARVDSLLKQRQILYDYYISKMREGEKDTSLMEQLTPSTPQVTHFDNDFIRNILQSVEENIQNSEFKIDDLAEAMSMSRTVFYRKVKSLMGVSPVDFVKTMRIKRAVQLLEQDEFTVSEVGYMSGFTTPQYFSRVFKEAMGCTPKEYRLKHKTIVEQNV